MRHIIQIFQALSVAIAVLIMLYAIGAVYRFGLPIIFVSERMFITIVGGVSFSFVIMMIVQSSHDKLMRTKIIEARTKELLERKNDKE